jgi:hypothetical protein
MVEIVLSSPAPHNCYGRRLSSPRLRKPRRGRVQGGFRRNTIGVELDPQAMH